MKARARRLRRHRRSTRALVQRVLGRFQSLYSPATWLGDKRFPELEGKTIEELNAMIDEQHARMASAPAFLLTPNRFVL